MDNLNTVRYSIDGVTAVIWLNRPGKGNSLNIEMIRELQTVISGIDKVPEVRFVVIRAEGKYFCSGADLNWMAQALHLTEEENVSDSLELAGLFESIFFSDKIFLALVHGDCYGGGIGLIAACDYVLAGENVRFAFGEATLGLVPATIAPFVYCRTGYQVAKSLMLSAEHFTASQAAICNLVDKCSDPAYLNDELNDLIARLKSGGPRAQGEIKNLLNNLSLKEYSGSLKEYTARLLAKTRTSEEGIEGISSFLEKRKPNWKV